jgi:tetratricopeptide (TPR) repeat protein
VNQPSIEQISRAIDAGRRALAREQFESALKHFHNAASMAPEHPDVWIGIGISAFKLGRFVDAADMLLKAQQMTLPIPALAIFRARALAELGDDDAARAALAHAGDPARLTPEDANEYALACIALKNFDQARKLLEAAVLVAPNDTFIRSNLAQVYERANRLEEALRLLQDIPLDGAGSLLHARLIARLGDPKRALEELKNLQQQRAGFSETAIDAQIDFERGRWLDSIGFYDEAFAAFSAGNQRDKRNFMQHSAHRLIEGALPWLKDFPELDRCVSEAAVAEVATPIFLVGFPRSGTTLLDQLLDAHPQLQVLEEVPLFDAIAATIARRPRGYPLAIADLDTADVEHLRNFYWDEVSRVIVRQPQTRLVDKFPLNLACVHLIERLFPRAKWIFAIRHPCDVGLSCFMQRFQFTPATQGFWSLPGIAKVYGANISLWLNQRKRLQIDCIDLRYEDLVRNPENEMHRLLAFLDLPWNDAVLNHDSHAKTRWIKTPSYDQVSQPIYTRASGRWQHYRKWFGEAEALFAPFVEALGYSPLLNKTL